MKQNLKLLGSIFIGGLGSYLANQIPNLTLTPITILLLGIGITCLLLIIFFLPTVRAYFRMYFIGKIRGLWNNGDLNNLIKNEYKNSDIIKIKVTRGHGLFYKENGIFNQCFFKEKYNSSKTVKILLHYPCLKSEHLKTRASANHISLIEYIEDLFKVLHKFKQHTIDDNTDEEISVRFYTSRKEKEWRFYVFKQHDQGKTLLFNHYDPSVPGAKSQMLRVKSGNESLCEDLNRTFDELFDDYSIELIENKKKNYKLINDNYCEHPACRAVINQSYNKIFNNS